MPDAGRDVQMSDTNGQPGRVWPSCHPSLGEPCGNCHRCTDPHDRPRSGRVQSDDLADDLAREMALYASITPNWSFGQMARQTLRVLRLSGYEVVREARDV